MNDWYNDPPDYPEPPAWYCMLEEAIQEKECPPNIATAVRCQMDDWCSAQNEYDPGPSPAVELPNDYFRGEDFRSTRPQDGRTCNCEDAPCCGCYSS